ncbi:unnamed protein product [Pocillopora meandrina]|uniref:Uncharacterized protein n=1 Tax=Pocillopora meandrina TaxID=46732 RepID=A0AAU9X7Q2_9CNID|nr:unnamed protein product [Pocillopora meandrina]
MPSNYKIEKKLKELNAKWDLQPIPGQAERVQLSFRESLEEQEISLQGKGVFHMNTKIKVKITAFKIDLPVFHSLVSSFTPYRRRKRVMTVKVTIPL